MPLGDARILFVDTGMAQHIGADRAVGEIWLRAVAVDAGCIGGYYAYVVKHGGRFDFVVGEGQMLLMRNLYCQVGNTVAML